MPDLAALEYPRFLHGGDGESLLVGSLEECETALAEGWHLEPWNHWSRCADSPAPEGVERPWLAEAPVKRKPGRPRKVGV